MKNTLLIAALFLICSCSSSGNGDQEVISDYLSEMDGENLEEVKEGMKENLKGLKSFINFFDYTFSNEIEFIEDESFDPVFKNDTTIVPVVIGQVKEAQFFQKFKDYKSHIEFEFKDKDFINPVSTIKTIREYYKPQKIYYNNGTIDIDSISKYDVSFEYDTVWGEPLLIDSIDVEYTIKYLSTYDEVIVSLDQPKANYNGGEILIEKIKDNYVYITASDTLNAPLKIEGLNEEGKVLHSKGYSYTDREPKEEKEVFAEMIEFLEETIEKLDNQEFKDTKELKSYIKKNASKLDYFKDNDGMFHRELYYDGTVKKVKLYFAKKYEKKKIQFTATTNTKFGKMIYMPTENGISVMDKKNNELFSVKGSDYYPINDRFYEDDEHYYHLNIKKKRMDTLFVYDIESYENGLVGIQKKDEGDYKLYSKDNKEVSKQEYTYLVEEGNSLFGRSNFKYYHIDKKGKGTLLKDVEELGDMAGGMISIKNENYQYGFINEKGKIVIPMIYDKVGNFSDGLVQVKNEDNNYETPDYYGYLNKKGNKVLGFKYERAHEFINGIALVKYDGTYKFIDKKGEVWIDTKSKGASINGKGRERVYSFNDGSKYDSYGILITQ
ncbi:WG repeat-containing protein [Aquimarina algiphila]|uniref:WG repeat-containing protein n=1 Tax=Aquimarina algiphila TaxID=2047982 RepID=UPI00249215E4|nr:WG repeat-containing protein [Aquimarina algiphila]